MSKLSRREKVLLYLLACVMIIAGALKFLILPSIEDMNDIQTKIDEAMLTEIEMKAKISNKDAVKANVSKTTEEINTLAEDFYSLMPNEDIDSLITELLISKALVPDSMIISPLTDALSDSAESQSAYSCIKMCYVNVHAIGTYSDLSRLIEEVSDDKALRISAFNIEGSYGSTDEAVSISIDFEVFMYDDSQE